jgi:predicted RNase H-like HicB family nuclease
MNFSHQKMKYPMKGLSTMTSKKLEHYVRLPYTIEVIPDDGACFVQIKELPGCMTEVDTWEEVLPAIEEAKPLWIELALESGRPIPDPVGMPSRD